MRKIVSSRSNSTSGKFKKKWSLILSFSIIALSIWVFSFHHRLMDGLSFEPSTDDSRVWFYFGPKNRPPIDYFEERVDRKLFLDDHSNDVVWNDSDSVFGPCSAFAGGVWGFGKEEKFMWYGSHSGFGNQVIQLKWALRLASLLNRTLILPPKTPRISQVKGLGTCGQKATPPHLIRSHAWNEYANMLRKPNYISLGDIINIKKIPYNVVRTVDFRHFVSFFCGCVIPMSCTGKYCLHISDNVAPLSYFGKDVKHCLSRCGKMIGSANKPFDYYKSMYTVNFTCSDTVWTMGNYSNLTELVRSVNKNSDLLKFAKDNANAKLNIPEPRNLIRELGPQSPAGSSMFLGFASTFQPRIIDMYADKWGKNVSDLFELTNKLTFTPAIWKSAHEFIKRKIKTDYFCVHFRGGDAWFDKNKKTHLSKVESKLRQVLKKFKKRKPGLKPSLFLMTDIKSNEIPKAYYIRNPDPVVKPENSAGRNKSTPNPILHSILAHANKLGFDIHSIPCKSEEIMSLSTEWLKKEYGFLNNRISEKDAKDDLEKSTHLHGWRFNQTHEYDASWSWSKAMGGLFQPLENASQTYNQSEIEEYVRLKFESTLRRVSLDFCFFAEVAVCSCARLGFQGTKFSTASNWIAKLRRQQDCHYVQQEENIEMKDEDER